MNLFLKVAEQAGEKLATPSELKALTRLQGEWAAAAETISHCGIDGAFCAYLDETQKSEIAARAGKLLETRTHSREEWELDFLRRGEAAREHQRKLTQETAVLARKVTERFCEAANATAAKVEKEEAARFAEWGVAYAPSALVLQLRQLADKARANLPRSEFAQISPASMLPFLKL
jgi:hypothetical protein